MIEPPDELDSELNAALASYGKGAERDGLEERVLARVMERAARAQAVRGSALLLGAIAAAVCCLVWPIEQKHPQPENAMNLTVLRATGVNGLPSTLPKLNLNLALAALIEPNEVKHTRVERRLPKFPTPHSIGSEERALVRLALEARRGTVRGLSNDRGPIKPIEVAAIEIKPLK